MLRKNRIWENFFKDLLKFRPVIDPGGKLIAPNNLLSDCKGSELMVKKSHYNNIFVATLGIALGALLLPAISQAIPLGSADDKNQGRITGDWMFRIKGDEVHPSHYPNSNVDSMRVSPDSDGKNRSLAKSARNNLQINEPHPVPEYIENMSGSGKFSTYYREVLNTAPVDYLQSKVFDPEVLRNIKKILIYNFENKTSEPFRNSNAGKDVALGISEELKSIPAYTIIPPVEKKSDLQLQIFAPEGITNSKNGKQSASPFAEAANQADAVLIGAVTKYSDTYINRKGFREDSQSSVLEFGAYLVQPSSGKVVWGARYVSKSGGKATGWFRFKGKISKEDHSRSATRALRDALRSVSTP